MRRYSNQQQAIALLVASLVLSVVAIKDFPLPFGWVGIIWAIVGFALARTAVGWLQALFIIGASTALGLGLGEIGIALTTGPAIEKVMMPRLHRYDTILGWGLPLSTTVRAIERIQDFILYDVVYTVDSAGRRVAPPDSGRDIEGCALFFVDSFAFGEGVADSEAFPYRVGIKTGGRFRIVNYSAPGYGAEHMLAMLEHSQLALRAPCEPTFAFYLALPHHALRSAGRTEYSRRGPRYQLALDGTYGRPPAQPALVRGRGSWSFRGEITEQLSKSRVYSLLTTPSRRPTEADLQLYFAIVNRARALFNQRWPHASFVILAWNVSSSDAGGEQHFYRELRRITSKVHFVDDILPGYRMNPADYSIHHRDLHLSARAHDLIAAYITDRILPPQANASPMTRPLSGRRFRRNPG